MSTEQSEIRDCEVCGRNQLTPVLNLGLHPMCDDLVPIGDSRVCREYPIDILFCETCFTAHQRFQVPKRDLFPNSYHYRSRFTADVLNGMAGLVESCVHKFGSLGGMLVLDVGCNDGSLLDLFAARGARTMGIEPTGACIEASRKGHVTFNEFISNDLSKRIVSDYGHPSFITFTNVFAHIENLGDLIESLRQLSDESTVIVIENHYLGSVLDKHQFDTFYHEHPRSYSYTSFVHIAQALVRSLLDVEFPDRYGGNIRVFIGNEAKHKRFEAVRPVALEETLFLDRFRALGKSVTRWQEVKSRELQGQIQSRGKLKAKAFPGRAAILVKLLGLTDETISAVYEKPGSLKIGHYLPGTRIPILSDEALFASEKDEPILNLAWHISGEVRSYLYSNGYSGKVIDVLSGSDFSPR